MPKNSSFLKWAGGKSRIRDDILNALPPATRLIEPFTGSGAVFIGAPHAAYILADTNADLMHLYKAIQADAAGLLAETKKWFDQKYNTEAAFKQCRTDFNASTDVLHRAALFIYLNRHAFNGLCRYNGSGKFNVPFGRYKRPYFPEEEIKDFAVKLQTATLLEADFLVTMSLASPGDVVYCDPPYLPLSNTANFTSYSPGAGFGLDEQVALAEKAEALQALGISVVISNHDTAVARHLYRNATEIRTLMVRRSISGAGASRGEAPELLAIYR